MAADDDGDGPVERLIYFFLPLPEPLQLPDDYRIETHDIVSFTELRRAHQEGRQDNWNGEYLLASSRIWQTTVPVASHLDPMLRAARQVVHRAIPTLNHKVGSESQTDSGADILPKTVVEIAVRVTSFDDDDMGGAFEVAVECVQAIQRAHYLVTRRPLTLLTVENAPVLVLMAQREAHPADGPTGGWPDDVAIYMPNTNVQAITPESIWDQDDLEKFTAALAASELGSFIPMAQLIEEAQHALHRRGDYRAAITLLYSATEVMFDTLLTLILWEENKTPEQAHAECFSEGGLQTRLRRHYAPKMRGNWHLDRKSVLSDWNRDLASVRHRIVHAGYLPSREEAYQANSSFDALHNFITQRVTIGEFIRQCPVTALSFMGIDGMKQHGRWTRRLERLVDEDQVEWAPTFHRWNLRLDWLRTDAEPVEASDEELVPVFVLQPDGNDTWWLHDTVNRRVIQTAPPAGADDHQDLLNKLRADYESAAPPGARGSAVYMGQLGEQLADAQWLPEHEVLPLHGIMRDGSDMY